MRTGAASRAWKMVLATALIGIVPAAAHGFCGGDCNADTKVTVNELLTMVNIAVGNAASAACPTGEGAGDGRITIDELVTAVGHALNGCPVPPTPTPSPKPNPLSAVQTTNLVFSNVLPQLGATMPSVDAMVNGMVTAGLDPFLGQVAALEPSIREQIPNGIRVNLGSGTNEPIGLMAGTITATYSNVVQSGNTISFDGTINTENVTVNGGNALFDTIHASVTATQKPDGKSTINMTVNGTGSNPAATTTGNIVVDTARCPNYPVSGSIKTTVGGSVAEIRFNDNCDGTFNSLGTAMLNFSQNAFNCDRGWYSWTRFAVVDGTHITDDRSEPPYLTVDGTVTDTDLTMSWRTLPCSPAPCTETVTSDGTFVGHFWKEETDTGYGLNYVMRYYIGTYTTRMVRYNPDGSVHCDETRILNEQDGMDDVYHFWLIRRK